MQCGGGADAELDGAAEQHGNAARFGDMDQALGSVQAAGLDGHDIEDVDRLVSQKGQGEGVVEVGDVLDNIGGHGRAHSGQGCCRCVRVGVNLLGMVLGDHPRDTLERGFDSVDAQRRQRADAVDGLFFCPCARGVGFEIGVGAGAAAKDADALAVELEVGADLELVSSETGVDFSWISAASAAALRI